ncbi:hypothetical protein LMF32_01100 [Desemzia sp. C1]|uniref:hypothetical protein n=1 Tax=unclassified Desemzia TaxID=2685243 RepID=UPI001E568D3F|nr:hypothetical protein [Desemzia sp. C1]MCI3027734.1 hypothetical protein [Desemzia sp. C1]
MIIIEMTEEESEFVAYSTENTGAYRVRTFDIDNVCCLFAYYFDEFIHLKIRRYVKEQTAISDWFQLKSAGIIYPDIILDETIDVRFDLEENQIHVQLPNTVNERNW